MKYIAFFIAQSWINDHAVIVDVDGPNAWDVTNEIELADETLRQKLLEGRNTWSDGLRDLAQAPEWVRKWDGPFEVSVSSMDDAGAQAALESYGESAVPASEHCQDLEAAIPDSDGLYGRAFRDALESMRLALEAEGVSKQVIDNAIITALDAYGNNADTAKGPEEIHEVLMVSTTHLLPSEREEILERDELHKLGAGLVLSMTGEYGYLVSIQPVQDAKENELPYDRLHEYLSPGFAGCVQHAIKRGMSFVRFDTDGPILAGIETYDDEGSVEAEVDDESLVGA